MTLSDDDLRAQLERRARSETMDLSRMADSISAQVAGIDRSPWWRRGIYRLAGPMVGAAAVVIVVVGLAAIRPPAALAPGASQSAPITPSAPPSTPQRTPVLSPGPAGVGIVRLAVSHEVVELAGFDTTDVTVTVEFTGPVEPVAQMDGTVTPLVCIEKVDATVDGHVRFLVDSMVQAPGTNEWSTVFRMTSAQGGAWRISCLVAHDAAGSKLDVDPGELGISPALEVVGTHAPNLTMEFDPRPVIVGRPLTVHGQVTDEDTGDPYPGVVVAIGRDNVCAEGGGGTTVTTDSSGMYSYTIPVADESAVCAWITDVHGLYPGIHTADPVAVYATRFAHPTEP